MAEPDRLSAVLIWAAALSLTLLTATLAIAAGILLLGGGLEGPVLAIAALAATGLGAAALTRATPVSAPARGVGPGAALAAGLWLTAILLAGSVYDWSWDGQHYHQELVLQLARGWNPVWETFRVADVGLVDGELDLWLNHYPRAGGVLGAAVYGVTDRLETAKFVNPLLMALTGLYAAALLRRIAGLSWLWTALMGLALASNAIASAQALSFYNDGLLFCALALIALAGGHLVWLGPDLLERRARAESLAPALILVGAVFLAACVKFTGLVFAVAALGFVGLAALRRAEGGARDRIGAVLPLAGLCAGAVLLALLAFGPSSYLQNLAVAGHPFHPVMGADAFDIITRSKPRAFLELSGPEALYASLFGLPENNIANYAPRPLFHLVSAWELTVLSWVDPRIGGWGAVFPELLILALLGAAALLLFARDHAAAPLGAYGLGAALLLALIHPEAWWARYSSFLIIGPWILFAAAAAIPLAWTRALAGLGLALMLVNNLPVAWTATAKAYEVSAKINAGLDEIAAKTAESGAPARLSLGLFHANRIKLAERGIPHETVPRAKDLPCEDPPGFYNGHWISRICY